MEKEKIFWFKAIFGIILVFGALGIAYLYGFTPCKIAISLNPQIEFCRPTPQGFNGTWQGADPYDGSTISLSLVQTGNKLIGTNTDTFSPDVEPPGYHGSGSGTVLSPTTAQIIFNLSRWDGSTAKWAFHLTLSNQNNTIIFDDCYWNDIYDPAGCPVILDRR